MIIKEKILNYLKKSDIITFYINRKEKDVIKILSNEDIDKLYKLYDEIKFKNINSDFLEAEEGKLENKVLPFEFDEEF